MAQDDIQGQVVDAQGNPVSGAIVELTKSYQSSPTGQEAVQRTTTDSNGNYIFTGHPDGDGTTQEWHVSCYNHDGTAYVNSFNNPGVTADLPSNAIPDSGVSYWKFDDTSDTTTAVDTWSGFDGVINGATYTSTSHEGGALDFSSSSDFVTIGTNSSLEEGDTFSISTYIRTTDSNIDNESRTVVKQGGGGDFDGWWLTFQPDGSGSARFAVVSGSYDKRINGSTAVNDGQYHHIVGTYDSNSSQRLYVDGSLEASVTGGPSPSTGHKADMLFGRREDGAGSSFTGQMDEIKFYNKTLTDTEVSNLNETGSI